MKYLLPIEQKDMLKRKLELIGRLDSHCKKGFYFIRSLYFDDIYDSAYREKINGTDKRKKWRIRTYDYDLASAKLECKHKLGVGISKRSAKLSGKEYEKIINKDYDFLLRRKEDICTEFYYECITNRMSPKVIVDYDRIPFVYPYGNVRITFDLNLRAAIPEDSLADKLVPTFEVMPGFFVLEVKYTEFLPEIFRNVLYGEVENSVAVSKYVMCCDKVENLILQEKK